LRPKLYCWCWDGLHSALHLPWPTGAQHIIVILHLSNGVATHRNFWGNFPWGESPTVPFMCAKCRSIVWRLCVIYDKFAVKEIWSVVPSCVLDLYPYNSDNVIQVTVYSGSKWRLQPMRLTSTFQCSHYLIGKYF
jgi:hypothetical protein